MLARLFHFFHWAARAIRHALFGARPIEILSKEDARSMFTMSCDQWNENVRQAVAAGISQASGDPESGLSMWIVTPQSYLLGVRPEYIEDSLHPNFIQVSVGYRDPVPTVLNDAALKQIIEVTKKQMEPEYDVIGDVDRVPDGISLHFSIFNKRSAKTK